MLVIRDDSSSSFFFLFSKPGLFKVWPLWVSAIRPELPEFFSFLSSYFEVVVQDGPERLGIHLRGRM